VNAQPAAFAWTWDAVVLVSLGAALAVLFLVAVARDVFMWARRRSGPLPGADCRVVRGGESRAALHAWFSSVGLVVIIGLLALTDVPHGGRVAAAVGAIAMWGYLCMLSPWFRNVLMRLKVRYEKRAE
jgi:hypothetical protein